MQKQGPLLAVRAFPDPAARPSRLPPVTQAVVSAALGLSFITGIAIWWWQVRQQTDVPAPAWYRPAVLVHGILFPVQCGIFGWLACQHFRISWELRANLVSGFLMEGVFLGLIISSVGLYYAGETEWRDHWILTHRILGVVLPVALAAHWMAGLRWAGKNSK